MAKQMLDDSEQVPTITKASSGIDVLMAALTPSQGVDPSAQITGNDKVAGSTRPDEKSKG